MELELKQTQSELRDRTSHYNTEEDQSQRSHSLHTAAGHRRGVKGQTVTVAWL